MSANLVLQKHLEALAARSRVYTNEQLLAFIQALTETITELASVVDTKANATDVTNALKLKADASSVKDALSVFNALGLVVDKDGDIAQDD